jgi:sugar/nucleoside kinase (ribokinase family)
MIVVFGTVCLDIVRRVPRLPAVGGYVEVEEELRLLGGEAANTANALNAWGAQVRLYGNSLGRGRETLEALLRQKGLSATTPVREDFPTPICEIYVTPDGDRTMFGQGFKDMDGGAEPEAIEYVPGAWFTAEPNMADAGRTAVRLAHEAGMRIYLMDFVREDESIPPGSFWQSSTDWAGTRGNVQRNMDWVRNWVERHRCFAILSDGPNGFVAGGFAAGDAEFPVRHYPPFPAPSVVDTTGAGDMFRAGVLFGLDQGWALADCLRFGSAAGCLKCRTLGATTEVPTREEILAHVAAFPSVSRQYA